VVQTRSSATPEAAGLEERQGQRCHDDRHAREDDGGRAEATNARDAARHEAERDGQRGGEVGVRAEEVRRRQGTAEESQPQGEEAERARVGLALVAGCAGGETDGGD
jgi:hypothetical protein